MSKLVDFQQQMNALRQAYVEQLPTRIRQIETLWMAACNGTCTQAGLNLAASDAAGAVLGIFFDSR